MSGQTLVSKLSFGQGETSARRERDGERPKTGVRLVLWERDVLSCPANAHQAAFHNSKKRQPLYAWLLCDAANELAAQHTDVSFGMLGTAVAVDSKCRKCALG